MWIYLFLILTIELFCRDHSILLCMDSVLQSSKRRATDIITISAGKQSNEINLPDMNALRLVYHDQAPVITGFSGMKRYSELFIFIGTRILWLIMTEDHYRYGLNYYMKLKINFFFILIFHITYSIIFIIIGYRVVTFFVTS